MKRPTIFFGSKSLICMLLLYPTFGFAADVASIDFPEAVGRYAMLKWHPAAAHGERFSIAQVAAVGPAKRVGGSAEGDQRIEGKRMIGGKEVIGGKRILDNKDIPAEGPPEAPAEGPPPALPLVPIFTFIPEVPPTSP